MKKLPYKKILYWFLVFVFWILFGWIVSFCSAQEWFSCSSSDYPNFYNCQLTYENMWDPEMWMVNSMYNLYCVNPNTWDEFSCIYSVEESYFDCSQNLTWTFLRMNYDSYWYDPVCDFNCESLYNSSIYNFYGIVLPVDSFGSPCVFTFIPQTSSSTPSWPVSCPSGRNHVYLNSYFSWNSAWGYQQRYAFDFLTWQNFDQFLNIWLDDWFYDISTWYDSENLIATLNISPYRIIDYVDFNNQYLSSKYNGWILYLSWWQFIKTFTWWQNNFRVLTTDTIESPNSSFSWYLPVFDVTWSIDPNDEFTWNVFNNFAENSLKVLLSNVPSYIQYVIIILILLFVLWFIKKIRRRR